MTSCLLLGVAVSQHQLLRCSSSSGWRRSIRETRRWRSRDRHAQLTCVRGTTCEQLMGSPWRWDGRGRGRSARLSWWMMQSRIVLIWASRGRRLDVFACGCWSYVKGLVDGNLFWGRQEVNQSTMCFGMSVGLGCFIEQWVEPEERIRR